VPLYTLRIGVSFVKGEAMFHQQLRTVMIDAPDGD
jgi:hypothetical protein